MQWRFHSLSVSITALLGSTAGTTTVAVRMNASMAPTVWGIPVQTTRTVGLGNTAAMEPVLMTLVSCMIPEPSSVLSWAPLF